MSVTPDQKMLGCRRFAERRAPVHWAKQLFDAGQRKHFTYARRFECRQNRNRSRSHCKRMLDVANVDGLDALDDLQAPAPAFRDWKEQGDYLAPLYHFLESRVDKNWDATYSILASRTNRNSTVGDHLWLHLWHYVERETHKIEDFLRRPSYRSYNFYVDASGTLRRFDPGRPRNENRWTREKLDRERAFTAFGENKIVVSGEVPFFGYLTRVCPLSGRTTYRQGHALPAELRMLFATLSPTVRREWTYAPLDPIRGVAVRR